MNRMLLIARREYVAYIKTVGFWISMLLTPVSMGLFWGGPLLLQRAAPVAHISVINLTGSQSLDGLIIQRLTNGAGPGGQRGGPPPGSASAQAGRAPG
ncbi:MAG: transporter permease, partial [Caulobacteraceae bacterium]|nr:transporter permease [Caulobacteraceae bacterium]